MQNAFLEEVAQELLTQFGQDLHKLHIILPSRRAGLYLKLYLAENLKQPTFAPQILAMDDFIQNLSGLHVPSQAELVLRLYQSFLQFSTQFSVEEFAPIARLILADFNFMDRNLVPPEKVFEALSYENALARWRDKHFEDIAGKIAAQDGESELGKGQKKYLNFWQDIQKTYYHFRNKLQQEGLAYSGLAYRIAVEQLEERSEATGVEKIVLVGFFEMQKADAQIFNFYAKKQDSFFAFWEADEWLYQHPETEAALFFRRHQEQPFFQNFFPKKHLGTSQKQAQITETGNAVTMAKVAGERVEKLLKTQKEQGTLEEFKENRSALAIVISDERLLEAVLTAMPEEVNGEPASAYINVTTGVALDQTPLYDLIENLFSLQESFFREDENTKSVYFKDFLRILRHPYYLAVTGGKDSLPGQIYRERLIYLELSMLEEAAKEDPDLEKAYAVFFQDWERKTPLAMKAIRGLTAWLSTHFLKEKDGPEREYLLAFHGIVEELDKLYKLQPFGVRTLRHTLLELMRQTKVPFVGEPLRPIQIMGFLETRALDFEQVLLLSCNEGVMPAGKTQDALLPPEIRSQFGMPTYAEQDATAAYHFFRLFFRCPKVEMLYTSAKSGIYKGEPSRFLLQIQQEWAATLENFALSEKVIGLELPEAGLNAREIQKDEAILQKIEAYLTNPRKGLTPSFLNRYLFNPFEFFVEKVLEIRTQDELSGEIRQNVLGDALHIFLENALEDYVGKELDTESWKALHAKHSHPQEALTAIFAEKYPTLRLERGMNYLLLKKATQVVPEFFKDQAEEAPIHLLAVEGELRTELPLELENGKKIVVQLHGIADRIDVHEGKVRIIDYKTGRAPQQDTLRVKLSQVKELALHEKPEDEKLIQLLFYRYLLEKNRDTLPAEFRDYPIEPGFVFFRKRKKKSLMLLVNEEGMDFNTEFEAFLQAVISDMLDENTPIREHFSFEDVFEANAEEA